MLRSWLGETSEFFFKRRKRLEGLPTMICCFPAVERRTLPEPVNLNRLAAPRCDFILGIFTHFPFGRGRTTRSQSVAQWLRVEDEILTPLGPEGQSKASPKKTGQFPCFLIL